MTFKNYNREHQLPVLTIVILLSHQGGPWGAWQFLTDLHKCDITQYGDSLMYYLCSLSPKVPYVCEAAFWVP